MRRINSALRPDLVNSQIDITSGLDKTVSEDGLLTSIKRLAGSKILDNFLLIELDAQPRRFWNVDVTVLSDRLGRNGQGLPAGDTDRVILED